MTKTHRRIHKFLATVITMSLITSLLPAEVWLELFKINIVYAGSGQSISDSILDLPITGVEQTSSLPLDDMLFSKNEHNTLLQNFQDQALEETATQPLTISRRQSTYGISKAISNTLVITYIVTNNQLPAEMPQLSPSTSLTETLDMISTLNISDDPNVIHNVLFTDEMLFSATSLLSSSFPPQRNGNNYAWNLGDVQGSGGIGRCLDEGRSAVTVLKGMAGMVKTAVSL